MAANHSASNVLNADINCVIALLRDITFSTSLNLEMKSENPTPTGVWYRFHHGVSFSSWGEKITISLTPQGVGATRIDITSECGMPTQVVDWGKNKRNVCNIFEYIAANIGRFLQIPPMQQPVQQPLQQRGNRFCIKCGAQIVVGSAFCSQCGTKQS